MSELVVDVTFPGGKRVDASVGGFEIETDQAVKVGGEASAPEPFSLFLASIATCAGIFALNFCQSRDIDPSGLKVSMNCVRDPKLKRFSEFRLHLAVPPEFPEKYRDSLVRAVNMCAVKQHIQEPPEFKVVFDN